MRSRDCINSSLGDNRPEKKEKKKKSGVIHYFIAATKTATLRIMSEKVQSLEYYRTFRDQLTRRESVKGAANGT